MQRNTNRYYLGFRRLQLREDIRRMKSWCLGGLQERGYGEKQINKAQNEKFCRLSLIETSIQRSYVFKKSFRGTPGRQNVKLRIVVETRFPLRKGYGFVAMAGFGILCLEWNELHAGPCCAVRQSPALFFLRPFD